MKSKTVPDYNCFNTESLGSVKSENVDQVMNETENKAFTCKWRDCEKTFENLEEDESVLLEHVLADHMKQSGKKWACCWATCQRSFSGDKARLKLLSHFRTHLPIFQLHDTQKSAEETSSIRQAAPTQASEVVGVPLTAALVLRNMARPVENWPYFFPYESDLLLLMLSLGNTSLARLIANVLGELSTPED